ncbi:hypothetical protein AB4E09_19700 [Clostridioides difficile]|nr:hypothetical protein [Clostridioides difficile]MDV5911817.1 hypothetical protein [Clostridioides difficile]
MNIQIYESQCGNYIFKKVSESFIIDIFDKNGIHIGAFGMPSIKTNIIYGERGKFISACDAWLSNLK